MSKKVTLALIFICILSISINIFQFNKISNLNNEELQSVLTFNVDDVKEIMVVSGSDVLSYNYKIEPEIALQISNQLIINNKKSMKGPIGDPYSYGTIVNISLKSHNNREAERLIKIIPKDENSVFVKIDARRNSGGIVHAWLWSVESSWLAQFIKKVEKELAP